MGMNRSEIEEGYREMQGRLASALEALDGTRRFRVESWERPGGGGGESWALAGDGAVERAAVNVSGVWGETPPAMSERVVSADTRFYATGISTIVHPRNPHAPTFHANLRYFETESGAWFGGGADLTPYYLYIEDARHFHGRLRSTCDRHAVADYPVWKAECDRYFYLPHRQEARGVGGIFFDHVTEDLGAVWDFQQDLGASLVDAYLPILERRVGSPFGPDHDRWHELRRGRYVEFNLVWDRGTRFGLETGGRTASILASLPPRARWDEDFLTEPGSPEEELLDLVRGEPRAW
ncbi:oxygen-dependent coproporphyrinogen oxidase [soil metagenome]